MADREILESPTLWLSDSVIYAASKLLSQQAGDIDGWQSSQCGRDFKFRPVNARQKYVQILHDRGHWITVSNIDTKQHDVTASVHVYDSYQPSDISLNVKKQVCSLIRSSHDEVTFDIINIMPQPNSCDCGIFAIACATELAYGHDPALCCWDVTQMRQHLQLCFESGKLSQFPTTKRRRVPFGRRVKHMVLEKIYCLCRMPNERFRPMIQCENCFGWFHFDCVHYDSSLEWKCPNCLQFLSETINDN